MARKRHVSWTAEEWQQFYQAYYELLPTRNPRFDEPSYLAVVQEEIFTEDRRKHPSSFYQPGWLAQWADVKEANRARID